MSQINRASVLRKGFGYLEGFRWHNNELWFSDVPNHKVYRMNADASTLRVAATLDCKPSGLGFPEAGDPLVVGMDNNTLRRIKSDGSTEIVADLSGYAVGANDMWVTSSGRAYITQIGFNLLGGGDEPKASPIVIVQPDGTIETAGEGLVCANGVQLTSNGKTLVVAETMTCRLNAFDVDEEGRLSNQRVIIKFDKPTELLDGLVIDQEDGIWVTVPFQGEVRRITLDGEVTDVVKTVDNGFVVSAALGGSDGQQLYLASANVLDEVRQGDFTKLLDGDARVELAEISACG